MLKRRRKEEKKGKHPDLAVVSSFCMACVQSRRAWLNNIDRKAKRREKTKETGRCVRKNNKQKKKKKTTEKRPTHAAAAATRISRERERKRADGGDSTREEIHEAKVETFIPQQLPSFSRGHGEVEGGVSLSGWNTLQRRKIFLFFYLFNYFNSQQMPQGYFRHSLSLFGYCQLISRST